MISHTPPTYPPEREPGARAFGQECRGRRIDNALTLRLCAEEMGKSMTWLSEVETGQREMVGADRADFERVLAGQSKSRLRNVRYF